MTSVKLSMLQRGCKLAILQRWWLEAQDVSIGNLIMYRNTIMELEKNDSH